MQFDPITGDNISTNATRGDDHNANIEFHFPKAKKSLGNNEAFKQ